MNGGNRIQEHIAEYSGKTVHVLVFQPASRSPFEIQYGKAVSAFLQKRSQIKIRRRKGILAVTDPASIEPDGKTGFHSLEGNPDSHPLPARRQFKEYDILPHRIEDLRDLPGGDIFASVPRILGIHICRNIIPFHLHIGRNMNVLPAADIGVRLLEIRNDGTVIPGIMELPESVQGRPQGGGSLPHLLSGGKSGMVGMGGQRIYFKNSGVLHDIVIKFFHTLTQKGPETQ